MEATCQPVPQGRVLEKLNAIMDRGDMPAAERHLRYWLEEARLAGDKRGQLTLHNELTGHYRKTGEKELALENAARALGLVEALELEGTLTAAVTRVNAATAMNAFGENEKSIELFRQARRICEEGRGATPDMLGGLYNNMALTLAALGEYDEALELYDLAMAQMARTSNGALEQAMTCLNRADALNALRGPEAAEADTQALLDQALELLATPTLPRDGYYAFVLEKCAPSYEYYGYFLDAERMREEAKRIYAGA